MFVAVVGCGHGEIDKIYEVIADIEDKRGIHVSLVLCCGDFQSVRNMTDLRCMACPVKYQQMHDFYRYYSGEKIAPILTIFIGGNHEASNYLQELPYGGWAAPNIYFMGNAGVLRYGHARIVGISGIYKGRDYLKGRVESPPYNQDSMRSVYHYRNLDTFRLKQIKSHVDIVLSHDWPKGIHNFGDTNLLLRQKPFFRDDIQRDNLGSRPLFEVLTALEPTYWFSAHLHVKFGANVPHTSSGENLGGSTKSESSTSTPKPSKTTKFLALDKVLPRRQFLQIIEIPGDDSDGNKTYDLSYDPEWLAILKSTDYLISTKSATCFMPGPGSYMSSRYEFTPSAEEIIEVEGIFNGEMIVPQNFTQTAPPHIPGEKPEKAFPRINPQTIQLCNKLGITDPLSQLFSASEVIQGNEDTSEYSGNQSDLNITYESSISNISLNPDEISLDLSDEESGPSLCNKSVELNISSTMNSPLSGIKSPRRKMMLPPPKSSTPVRFEDTEANDEHNISLLDSVFKKSSTVRSPEDTELNDEHNMSLLDAVFNKSCTEAETQVPQQLEDTAHFFVIDKVGEPGVKKRRNENFYRSDN